MQTGLAGQLERSREAPGLGRTTATVQVRHNIEMAHRLFLTPGKCQRIHGHSWSVTLTLSGQLSATGMVAEFGAVKAAFREYLDTTFDHRLLLNTADDLWKLDLPGAVSFPTDPTVEELARHLHGWAMDNIVAPHQLLSAHVSLWETKVNAAEFGTI